MSRLVLHIGTHKTATTSIQKFFHLNREVLADRGVYYPDYSLIGAAPHYAHLGIVNALSEQHEHFTPKDAKAFFSEVRIRKADHDVTVISAEPFYRHVEPDRNGKVPRRTEAYWAARRAYIERVADIVGAAEVVVVFRRQADYAQSLYQEQVKVTRYPRAFGIFLKDFWFHFDFLNQARFWNEAFPGLTALSFEHLKSDGDVEGAFCAALGIEAEDLPRPGFQNQALLPDLVVLKRMLHPTSHPKGELRSRVDAIGRLIGERAIAAGLHRRSFFSSADKLHEFQRGFDEDNATLARTFMRNLPEGSGPFPEPDRDNLIYGDSLHPRFLDILSEQALQGGIADRR